MHYEYDYRGNRKVNFEQSDFLSEESAEFRYNEKDCLCYANVGEDVSYIEYGANGCRYVKQDNSDVEFYVYDQNGRLNAIAVLAAVEVDGTEETVMYPIKQYIRGPDRVLAQIDINNNIYYYLYNGHDDVVQIVDTNGNIKNRYDYDVWGNFLKKEETIENSITYFGQTYDEETELYYLRARYYDPTTGRFTQQDPAEDGYNWYVYGNQNPVMYVDYTGEGAQEILGGSWSIGAGAASLDGPLPYGDIIGGAIGVGGTIVAGGYWLYETLSKYFADAKAKEISEAITKTKKDSKDTIIYRTGSGNATNLTPRSVDVGGLSYTTTMPTSDSFTITSMARINASGVLMAVKDGTSHVSVKPVDGSKMKGWIDSRDFAAVNPHEYTVLLQSLSIRIK